MNWSSGRRKPRIITWLHLYLSICLLVSLPEAGQAQQAPDRKREFLEMYARAYYPGRSGQIMLVPREGDFATPMELGENRRHRADVFAPGQAGGGGNPPARIDDS